MFPLWPLPFLLLAPAIWTRDSSAPLYLTPLIERGELENARNASSVRPFRDDVKSYAGYLTVDKVFDSHTFFWYFPSERNATHAPLVLWLQGGPGTPLRTGVFVEHGPYVFKRGRLERRQYAWCNEFNVLYVDNPVGVGFSHTRTRTAHATNQTTVAEHLYEALRQFLLLFPRLRRNKIIVAGESYAGKYAPALARTVRQKNDAGADFEITLYGLLLGNPMFSPEDMLQHGPFLYAHGLLDANQAERMQQREQRIRALMRTSRWSEAADLYEKTFFEGVVVDEKTFFYNLTGLGQHFNALQEDKRADADVERFMRRRETREALHAGEREYDGQNAAYEYLKPDLMQSMAAAMEEALQHHRVLVYTGQLDVLFPHCMQERAFHKLRWSGALRYYKAGRQPLYVDQYLAGYVKKACKFTDVLVRNSGHIVAADKPQWGLAILRKFANGELTEGTC